jgi:beta-hydroxylase
MSTVAVAALIGAYVLLAMVYVYRFRGQVRHDSLSQYLRKSWPIFAPLNCMLYAFTERRARKSVMDVADFPELQELRAHWQTFRDEALELQRRGMFESARSPGSPAYYDVGFRTFFKYGWSKFYLQWYGYTHASALSLCPGSVEILRRIPRINGAMFSLLPPGSQLTRHSDPIAVSLRYHLGLATPNADTCFIDVDGQTLSWRDGEMLMFDETYLHFARNDSSQHRLILMCDIERPMSLFGRGVNFFYKQLVRNTVVPNLKGDRRGFASAVFATIAPLLARSKRLKETHLPLYRLLKYGVNSLLLVIVAMTIFAGIRLVGGGLSLLL